MSLEEIVQRFRAHGCECRWTGTEWRCQCPAHPEGERERKDRNLSLSRGMNGCVLVKCQSHGCDVHQVAPALGLKVSDFAAPGRNINGGRPAPEVVYPYRDERGRPEFEIHRLPGKKFVAFRREASGELVPGMGRSRRLLFGVPELLETKPGDLIAITEGEKDAVNLAAAGVPSTTNPFGAEHWVQEQTDWLKEHLADRRFVILPDNDEKGQRHADQVYQSLKRAGLDCRIIALPDLPEKGDVSDWLRAGATGETLRRLAAPAVRFPLLTIEEMLDLPPPVWQVETLWEQGGVVMVFGEGSSGKTFLVVDVCMHLVREMGWHGRAVKGGSVIYINADGGIPFRLRPQAWMFEHPEPRPIFPFLIHNDRIDMRDRGRFAQFVEELKDRGQAPAVIVIDTFHRCMPGADENDAKDTSLFFDALGIARRELGATTVFLHHSNRADTGHRGHSSLRDDADTAIEVRRESSGLRRVRCDKQRNGVEFPEFFFDLRPTLGGESCVIEMSDPPAEDDDEGRSRRGPAAGEESQIQSALRHVIAAGEITQAELSALMQRSQPRVSFYCRTLRQRGLITIRRGLIDAEGRRPDIYEPRPELRR